MKLILTIIVLVSFVFCAGCGGLQPVQPSTDYNADLHAAINNTSFTPQDKQVDDINAGKIVVPDVYDSATPLKKR